MTEMQAAIGIVQLKKLDDNNNLRRRNTAIYREKLKSLNLELPYESEDVYHVYHLFQILLPEDKANIRNDFAKALNAEGVPMDIIYPYPLYVTNVFKNYSIGGKQCPNTENVTKRIVTLFTDPKLDTKYIENFCDAIKKVATYYL
jgi:dTDP-4-amino-4,6-dideoxygalactose transaminase